MIDQTTDITLTEEKCKIKIKLIATIHKTGPKAGMAVQGMLAGFTQQLDKLDAFLAAHLFSNTNSKELVDKIV